MARPSSKSHVVRNQPARQRLRRDLQLLNAFSREDLFMIAI